MTSQTVVTSHRSTTYKVIGLVERSEPLIARLPLIAKSDSEITANHPLSSRAVRAAKVPAGGKFSVQSSALRP
jgi:hypothetical protein